MTSGKRKQNYFMIILLFVVTTLLLLIGSIGELFGTLIEKITSKERKSQKQSEQESVTHTL